MSRVSSWKAQKLVLVGSLVGKRCPCSNLPAKEQTVLYFRKFLPLGLELVKSLGPSNRKDHRCGAGNILSQQNSSFQCNGVPLCCFKI
jgi:hypothetical protein